MDTGILLLIGAVGGLVAAMVMNLFMRAVGRKFGRSADMVQALGSFFTKKLENAAKVGTAIHCAAGIAFGMIYLAIVDFAGMLDFPAAIFMGAGIGFAHGLVTSFILMVYASQRHPLEEFRKATMQEGALHFFGHILFGAVVGLLGGIIVLGV